MIYPNPLPFKLRVLRALTDALKEITPANGYVSDMADFDPGDGIPKERVYRGRMWFGEDDTLPMLSILEGTSPADEVAEPPVNTATQEVDWHLLVQGFVVDDPVNPTDPAYVLMADVRKRIVMERKRKDAAGDPDPFALGVGSQSGNKNQIVSVSVGPGVVRPADDVSSRAWWWFSLTIRIIDNAEAPYA